MGYARTPGDLSKGSGGPTRPAPPHLSEGDRAAARPADRKSKGSVGGGGGAAVGTTPVGSIATPAASRRSRPFQPSAHRVPEWREGDALSAAVCCTLRLGRCGPGPASTRGPFSRPILRTPCAGVAEWRVPGLAMPTPRADRRFDRRVTFVISTVFHPAALRYFAFVLRSHGFTSCFSPLRNGATRRRCPQRPAQHSLLTSHRRTGMQTANVAHYARSRPRGGVFAPDRSRMVASAESVSVTCQVEEPSMLQQVLRVTQR